MGEFQPQSPADVIFTVGHSVHSLEHFLALLSKHHVTALGDVRSKPYSKMNPQFNREPLKLALRDQGVRYVFLGGELGARSSDPACYVRGRVQYDRLAQTTEFQTGIYRVREGLKAHRIALMCAEKDPLECHRTILVARELSRLGISIFHILESGELETHEAASKRLRQQLRIPDSDMFKSVQELEADAYRLQGERIAYVDATHTLEADLEFGGFR